MLVKVGVYCLRGNGHWACYDEDDAAACGTKGPDVLIDVEPEDFGMYPEWLRQTIVHELEGKPARQQQSFWKRAGGQITDTGYWRYGEGHLLPNG